MEEFCAINGFIGYGVSSYGRVINSRKNVEMTRSPTAHGDLTVGLMRAGQQYRRSVKGLVARAFVDGETDVFDTPILLDGDRENLHAHNIVWRPRWFALVYAYQFTQPFSWWYAGPLFDITNGNRYDDIVNAAIDTGSLLRDIRESLMDHTRVFPHGGIFKFM